MSKLHYIRPAGPSSDSETVRLGAGTGSSNNLGPADIWKFVKLSATDTYNLCAAGNPIEGIITSIEPATAGGWTIGAINRRDKITVIADGLQATPGTGTIAAGDYVVTGTVVAKGTYLSASTGYPKVCKATVQPGAVPADLTAAGAQVLASLNAWRVVSLGAVGTGAVGTEITIERVSTGR
jgi:hypothetical protein